MVEKEMQFNDGNAGGGGVSNPNEVSNENKSDKSLLYVATFIVALVLLACVLAFL